MQGKTKMLVEKYNLYGCIQCGSCTGGCPVSLRSDLNPRSLVYRSVLQDDVSGDPEIWECTTCSTCKDRCPKGVSPLDLIVGIREGMVERGRLEPALRDALESTFKHGNPWGRLRDKRFDWAEGLELKNVGDGETSQWLYFVGCTPAYDPRIQKVAKALVGLFRHARFDFCVFGTRETCCGNEVKRMGELGLFEVIEEEQTKLFADFKGKNVVTTSPHCYNVFKNELPLDFEFVHYTQLLSDFLVAGQIRFEHSVPLRVAFHDPCFLGKQNGIYDEPRNVMSAIPGMDVVEFDRSRERSLCCEGGGGRMWIESRAEGERLAEIRVKDAKELKLDAILTACPFCLLTLEDAVKTTGMEESLKIMDIAEVALQSLREE
jgi:Fe-S oxidoreductase